MAPFETEPEGRQICPSRADDGRAVRLQTPYRGSARKKWTTPSAPFPDDDSALGPFLGNLPPEILDVVVGKLGWFETTFAMAGGRAARRSSACRARAGAHGGGTGATEVSPFRLGAERLQSRGMTPLAVAAMEGTRRR